MILIVFYCRFWMLCGCSLRLVQVIGSLLIDYFYRVTAWKLWSDFFVLNVLLKRGIQICRVKIAAWLSCEKRWSLLTVSWAVRACLTSLGSLHIWYGRFCVKRRVKIGIEARARHHWHQVIFLSLLSSGLVLWMSDTIEERSGWSFKEWVFIYNTYPWIFVFQFAFLLRYLDLLWDLTYFLILKVYLPDW